MFKKVLVGVDEETNGRDAIALAVQLRGEGCETSFAHVRAEEYGGMDKRRIASQEILETAIAEAGIRATPRSVAFNDVGSGLRWLAAITGADLIVIGDVTHSQIPRKLIGGHNGGAFRSDPAVAIAPAGFADRKVAEIKSIGVAYDRSAASRAAFKLARDLARETGADLSVFEVISLPDSDLRFGGRRFERAALQLHDDRQEIATELGIVPQSSLGDPVKQLAKYSKTVDLLVLGADGVGPLQRFLQQRKAASLIHEAHCPLLVVSEEECRRIAAETTTSSPFETSIS